MTNPYHEGQREFQDRFDTRRLADRLATAASDTFSPELATFIEARDMFFIATTDTEGAPDCSYKGGDPGFVRVVDESTLAFPAFDGNGMFRTLGNISVNPRVGLLFIDFESGSRLRVNGEAEHRPRRSARGVVSGSVVCGSCSSAVRLRQLPPIRPSSTRRCRHHRSCHVTPSIRRCRTGSSTPGSTGRCRRTTRRTTPSARALLPFRASDCEPFGQNSEV